MREARYVGNSSSTYRVLVGRPSGRHRIILKQALMKRDGKTWIGLLWLRIGTGGRIF
jgi:hypothetical protein